METPFFIQFLSQAEDLRTILTTSLIFFVFLGLIIHLLGAACFIRFFFKGKPSQTLRKTLTQGEKTEKLPGVTIIKTCYKTQDNEEENFNILFQQDYSGPLQILFVISEETDSIAPLITTYLKRYPKADAKIVLSKTRKAFWKKIDALYDAHQEVQQDFIIWSDSDVILKENYVTEMVKNLQEPGVSVVTTPQFDIRANNFASALKVIGNNTDVAIFTMLLDTFTTQKRVGFGQSLGFKKAEFDSFGEEAWKIMNTFLADDQALPYLFFKNGKNVVFRNIFCPVEFSNKSLSDVINQKIRWLLPQKIGVGNRYLYLLGMFFYPTVSSFFLLWVTGFSQNAGLLFLLSFLVRASISFLSEYFILGSIYTSLKYFWIILVWDLMQIYFFIYGFFKNSISFHQREFKVVNKYFLQEIDNTDENYSQEKQLETISP
jgi:cellulose synthase/poly-beta-1,6-N-acetylglucosamine synthase-like glycosyltransferase